MMSSRSRVNFLLTLALLLSEVVPGRAQNSTGACAAVDSALPGQVAFEYRDPTRFNEELHNTWSQGNADLVPACIAFPLDANQTSTIIKILNANPGVPFAVKSGGHNPNKGWASTQDGVLIAMSSNNATKLSDDKSTADIGPGSRWEMAMNALEPDQMAVVGGRIGNVGVGGYLLGGGLSFLSAEHGLACDTVTNFEVVLANGDIVNVNEQSNPDLFFALKGGGNQLGIVTKYTLRAFPSKQSWGGTRVYSDDHSEDLINAIHDFTTNYHDPKAAVILTVSRVATVPLWVMFYFYDDAAPPEGVLDQFNSIPSLVDDVKTQSYADVLTANNLYSFMGLRYLIRATTLPNIDSPDLYQNVYKSWSSFVDDVGLQNPSIIYNMAYQPIPVAIANASKTAGGNVLGFDPQQGDRMWMEFDISWVTQDDDELAWTHADNITATLDNLRSNYSMSSATKFGMPDGGAGTNYTIFMNDGMFDQPVIQSYPTDSQQRLRAAKQKYDPNGFFTTRTGGFKLE